jgi:hypothetical protein
MHGEMCTNAQTAPDAGASPCSAVTQGQAREFQKTHGSNLPRWMHWLLKFRFDAQSPMLTKSDVGKKVWMLQSGICLTLEA